MSWWGGQAGGGGGLPLVLEAIAHTATCFGFIIELSIPSNHLQ
jgi:hypothetical protein